MEKCRICLQPGEIPIFGDKIRNYEDLSKSVTLFGRIKIRKGDNLPKHMCGKCNQLLKCAILFRKLALQSDMTLRYDLEHVIADSNEETVTNDETDPVYEENNEINLSAAIESGTNNLQLEPLECDLSPPLTVEFQDNYEHTVKNTNKVCEYVGNNNKIKCNICDKRLSKSYLNHHMKSHGLDYEPIDNKIQCSICDRSFNAKYYKTHLARAHGTGVLKPKTKERVDCTLCNKSFEKQYYRYHLAAMHGAPHKKYVCDHCGKTFIQQSAFKRHLLVHENSWPVKCQLCSYRARHHDLIRIHMRIHTGDYRYNCNLCSAKFITKSNLSKHLLRHRGPTDFVCVNCKRGFYSKLELDRHFEAEHLGVKNHVCNICGKAFGYRNAMMGHQRKVHKRERITVGKGRQPLYLMYENKNEESPS